MLIIDRFEGDMAVVENDGGIMDIPRSLLPENAKEGDILIENNGGYTIDSAAVEKRRREIFDLQESLWE